MTALMGEAFGPDTRTRGRDATKQDAPPAAFGAGRPTKVDISLGALDTGRPEECDSWRHATKEELIAASPTTLKVVAILKAMDDCVAISADVLQA